MKKYLTAAVGAAMLLGGCLYDPGEADPELSETHDEILAANKLAANKLAANKLAANMLAANKLAATSLQAQQLMATADGREVMSFIVGCAMPTGQSLTLKDPNNVSYTYPGWIGLAPGWATRVPTVTERRWVTACLLARTNLYGVTVNISMRHDTYAPLATTASEASTYTLAEGAFFGDLFGATPLMYACASKDWVIAPQPGTFRACAMSSNGSTTECGFTYAGKCSARCVDTVGTFGTCSSSKLGTVYPEVITIFLKP